MKATISKEDDYTKDGLTNFVASLGNEKDKRSYSRFTDNKFLSRQGMQEELTAMYKTDWLAGKVVDIIPDDMCREWRAFIGDINPTVIRQLKEEENRINLSGNFNLAHKWARLYGTAFIVLSVDDGQTPDKPLDIEAIRPGGLRHIKTVDRHRLSNADVIPIQDPMSVNFGMPEFYRFNETSVKIHHTRMLRFDGVTLPFDEFRRNNYCSDSVLSRLYDSITNFNTVANSAASMVYETNVDILKIQGFMGYLSSAEGESMLRKRASLSGMMKSFNNMLMIDNEESIEKKSNSFSGLPELLDRYALYLSSASDIPATRLLGSSASGFNATGQGDLKNYYDTVRSIQKRDYKPLLDYADKIMAKSLGLPDESDMEYEFNSLFQMTPKEKSDIQYVNAQRDAIYIDREIVKESTVARELKQTATYTNITDEDIEALEDNDYETGNEDFTTAKQETQGEEEEEGKADKAL